jgi:selenocysteine lyase/cysteine desulfurase
VIPVAPLDFARLRSEIVGVDSVFRTPFGERLLLYADYTASGRCLLFVERYLMGMQRHYANTHTEDDMTGRSMTHLLHEAEDLIRRALNAGPGGRVVACETGATGAIDRLQRILGVALSPATRRRLFEALGPEGAARARERLERRRPVIFVGPYEHHSNEVTWREGLATVVTVDLASDGGIDLEHLDSLLRDPAFAGRPLIGSFSAASNVTGMISPVHDIARLLHRHGAIACFDYAASAPYVAIDMCPPPDPDGADPSLDAVFLSPHKFIGGPGSPGLLVFNERLYARDLPPTIAGGGTVDYVGSRTHDFVDDIEERERAGTPGVLQMLKAGLVFAIKEAVGVERIQAREHELTARALGRWARLSGMEILGNPDPERRVGIVSFNVRVPGGAYLHPKFLTSLLNDLFGIQSRAGCSCAGPYGHRLLDIDEATSERYRDWVRRGCQGLKPGWCRLGFHYAMDDAEADFIIDAVEFVARKGHRFLPLYHFDIASGSWAHRRPVNADERLSLEAALSSGQVPLTALPVDERRKLYAQYLDEAARLAAALPDEGGALRRLKDEAGELQYFVLPESSSGDDEPRVRRDA